MSKKEKTIKEKFKSQCKHFTGVASTVCAKGVRYEDVSDKTTRPYKFPCLASDSIFFGGSCSDLEYPTEQEADKEATELAKATVFALKASVVAKEHYQKTKLKAATVACPICGGDMPYVRSDYNGHFAGSCQNCGLNFRE